MIEITKSPRKTDIISVSLLQLILTFFSYLLLQIAMQFNIMTVVFYSKIPVDFLNMGESEKLETQKTIMESITVALKDKPVEFMHEYYKLVLIDHPSLFLISNILWGLCFILPAYFILHKRLKSPLPNFDSTLSFNEIARGIVAGIFTFTVIAILSILVQTIIGKKMEVSEFEKYLFKALKGNTYILSWSIYTIAIITGIIEELYFRGFLLTQFAALGSARIGLFFTSILFGMMHYTSEASPIIPFFLSIVGYFFGSYYLFTGNIWIPMIAHATYNSIGLIAAYFIGDQL